MRVFELIMKLKRLEHWYGNEVDVKLTLSTDLRPISTALDIKTVDIINHTTQSKKVLPIILLAG